MNKVGRSIKVLLVYPNPMKDNLIPIGISLLSACLKKAAHQTMLFDTTFYETTRPTGDYYREKNLQVKKTKLEDFGVIFNRPNMFEDFHSLIKEFGPDIIGLSVNDVSYPQGRELMKSIADLPVIKLIGGIYATFNAEELIQEDFVDMLCLGEGEDALVELCNRLSNNEDMTDIQNLWVKRDGGVFKNELRPLKNLDEVPFQDWDIYEEKRLYKPFLGEVKATGCFETTRGCNFQCTYCCNPILAKLYKGLGKFYREKSVERIVDEIKYFKQKYNLGFLKFADADFLFMKDERFNKFIELYRDVQVPFWMETHAENVTPQRIRLVESVGCKGMAIGIESGNYLLRKNLIKKNVTDEKIIAAFEIVKKNSKKMKICANNIIGFPYETRQQIFDTVELNRKINLDNPIVNIFNPYSGTSLRELCIREGFIDKKTIAGDYRADTVLNMPQISKKEIYGLQRTFPLYVKFSRIFYPLIRLAEHNNFLFRAMSTIYKLLFLK